MKNEKNKNFNTLYKAILSLETEEECADFFYDLCTIKELEAMDQRLEVCMLLDKAKNYNEISALTGASSATISRVRKCYYYSEGYRTVLKKLKNLGN